MSNKRFAERLNQELDEIGVPHNHSERIEILAKLLKSSTYKAQNILNGNITIATPYLQTLAQEFEVSSDWLLGKTNSKKIN